MGLYFRNYGIFVFNSKQRFVYSVSGTRLFSNLFEYLLYQKKLDIRRDRNLFHYYLPEIFFSNFMTNITLVYKNSMFLIFYLRILFLE